MDYFRTADVANTHEDQPLFVRIGDKWIDCKSWRKVHPGGAASLDRFRGQDATDAFASLHSKAAWDKVRRFKSQPVPEEAANLAPTSDVAIAFRKFRAELEANGWFERNWIWDTFYFLQTFTLCGLGTYLAWSWPSIAIMLIGLGMQQAGWVAHDYVHGRGQVSALFSKMQGGLINGFSTSWWSNKHNTHHVHTNQVGIDEDIANDPILHLYIPEESKDYFLRRFQHFYYHIVYAFLFVSWRIQSYQYARPRMLKTELLLMACNYAWLLYMPWKVSICSVLLGGWLVAEIVTATHQSEEIIEEVSYAFVEDQFRTTRDVHSDNILFNYMWGGMQYQLEHHLFPTMPKYRYKALVPLVRKFAQDNGLSYRTSSAAEIFAMNYQTMKKYASLLEEGTMS